MDLNYEYDDAAIQRISENLWKEDIHPNWKMCIWKRIAEFIFCISPGLCFYVSNPLMSYIFDEYEWQTIFVFLKGVWSGLFGTWILLDGIYNIWLCDMEVVEYCRWRRKIKRWMHRYTYIIKMSDQYVGVCINGKEILWRWEDVQWYRVYPQVLMLHTDSCNLYIDLRKTKREERIQMKKLLGNRAGINQAEHFTARYHLRSIQLLCKQKK